MTERDRFEEWYYSVNFSYAYLNRDYGEEEYNDLDVELQWQAWQARARLDETETTE